MKPKILFISFLMLLNHCFTQNLKDAYKLYHEPVNNHWISPDLDDFSGEYQIFLDKFIWRAFQTYEENTKVSFSIEVVSFPFVPDEFDDPYNDSNPYDYLNRTLSTEFMSNSDYMELSSQSSSGNYEGFGWKFGRKQNGGYDIYQKINNINLCGPSQNQMCQGDYNLISIVYINGINAYDYSECHIPHTILKHTLYFHCGEIISAPIIDSISWVYDNTRGMMNSYPFSQTPIPSKGEIRIDPTIYDVTFRPSFAQITDPFSYVDTSNSSWYNSGLKDPNDTTISISTGSVDYFPPQEMYPYAPFTECQQGILLYCDSAAAPYLWMTCNDSADNYFTHCVHPPPYVLPDAPLLNASGRFYAGYNNSGYKVDSLATAHQYVISTAFDLSIINPSEKIIYNPSQVAIECDLTFPCNYKFLTLHGKYPDKEHEVLHGDYSKEYWDTIDDFEFEYDRDYPVPVNCSTNSSCKSEYILDEGITLTFQFPIIIMDAHFRGTSTSKKTTIHYNPNRTYGNWTYDTASIELDSNIATLPTGACVDPNIDSVGNKSAFSGNSIKLKSGSHLKVLNGLTPYPKIQVNLNGIQNARIRVFDSMGSLKQTQTIVSNNQSVDCSSLKPGVYHAVLISNGEVIDKISFGKK